MQPSLIFQCWLMFRFLLIILVTNCALRIRFIAEQQTNIWIFNVAFKRLKHRVVISYTLCVGIMLAGPLQHAVLQTTKYHNARRNRINISLITTSPPSYIVVRPPTTIEGGWFQSDCINIVFPTCVSKYCPKLRYDTWFTFRCNYSGTLYFQHCQEIL